MKKLNKKQKEHIKKVFVKTINIFCYICTGILAVFLLIASLQSCRAKTLKGVSAESVNNSNYSYQLRDIGVVAMSQSDFEHYNDLFDLPNENVEDDYTLGYVTYFNYSLPTGTIYYNGTNNFNIEVYNLVYTFKVKSASAHVYYWRLDQIGLTGVDGNYYSLLLHYSNNATDYYLDYNEDDIFVTSSIYFNDITGIDLFMMYNQVSRFTFNRDFNFNAPMGLTTLSPYGTQPSGMSGTSPLFYKEYDVGWFVCNGQLFNKIRWRCMATLGAVTVKFSDGTIHKGPDGVENVVYVWLEYVNTETNLTINVNHRNQTAYMPSNSSYGYYYELTSTWDIDDYRNIVLLDFVSDSAKEQINRFNNNNQNSYSGNVISGDVNNIFTLIASAFTAWLPVMSAYLLPGITIGTLLFIPLVALLVFAIIRIIKK